MDPPIYITYLKYLSILNYGYNLFLVNTWDSVQTLTCEYDLDAFCVKSGKAVLEAVKLKPVFFYKVLFLDQSRMFRT